VLHAGFYYSADSLKARFCREGNQELRAYCLANQLPLNQCGKLVVAKDGASWPARRTAPRAASQRGETGDAVAAEAQRIEPR